MAGITLAWLIGETVIVWRSVTRNHRPPMPGELLGSSAFFALLAIIAEYQPARGAATLLAFGVDIAAYLEAPWVTVQQPAAAARPAVTGTTQAPSTTTAGGRG